MAADSREAQLLSAPIPTVPELAAQASPVSYVAPVAAPFLLLHGKSDRLIPSAQSARLYEMLRRAGTSVEFHAYDGADHMWLGDNDSAMDAVDRTIDFL
jgi:dipeptidyl aminopeptidase/acylaminoacyl peptidase